MNIFNLGERIVQLRKAKKWSQEDLAKAMEASSDMIGKYERNDNLCSIEVAFKLTDVFDVSVDYLLGKGQHASYYKDTIRRLEEIKNLDAVTKNTLNTFIATFLRDSKAIKPYA